MTKVDRWCPICGDHVSQIEGVGGRFLYCSDACRETAKMCSIPECPRQRAGTATTCRRHTPQPEIPGYRDVYCKVEGCGFGPRVKLYHHVNTEHDGSRAYVKEFGADSLVSAEYRASMRMRYADASKDGVGLPVSTPRRQRVCANGHAMRGDNVIHGIVVIKGKTYAQRSCRKCWYEWHNEHRREKRRLNRPAWVGQERTCPECGESFLQGHPRQRFCCRKHKITYHSRHRVRNARTPVTP